MAGAVLEILGPRPDGAESLLFPGFSFREISVALGKFKSESRDYFTNGCEETSRHL